jgi:long-chain acyl-CoA synthetase
VQGTENPATAKSIQNQCRAKFGPLVTPSKVLFIPAMPLLSSGKPDLPTIVKWTEDQK